MNKFKSLIVGLACCAALTISAAGFALSPQNSNQAPENCCDMQGCCKDPAAMTCCKKKSKGKNAHACCKGKDNAAACCCKGDSCPMPNKAKNTNTN